MSRKSRIHFEIKAKYIQDYLKGKKRICDISEELNITKEAIYK